jgi:hypothetical protein
MANFAVAHIGICGHTDVGAVRIEESFLGDIVEHIEDGRASHEHGIAFVFAAFADAVKDDDKDGTCRACNIYFFKGFKHLRLHDL